MRKRQQSEIELDAKLHDKQIKNAPASLNITKQERKEYDEQATALHERMKKRHKDMMNGH